MPPVVAFAQPRIEGNISPRDPHFTTSFSPQETVVSGWPRRGVRTHGFPGPLRYLVIGTPMAGGSRGGHLIGAERPIRTSNLEDLRGRE